MSGMGDALRDALQGGIADKLDSELLRGSDGLLTGDATYGYTGKRGYHRNCWPSPPAPETC